MRCFNILFVIKSYPGDLPTGNFFMVYSISLGVVGFAGRNTGNGFLRKYCISLQLLLSTLSWCGIQIS